MNDEMKAGYDRAKELAKEIWFDDNETEDASSRYYFNCGFAVGLKYQNLTTEEIEAIEEGIKQLVESDCISTAAALIHISTLRNLIERIKNESRITE